MVRAVALLLAGCGRIAFDPLGDGGGIDAAPCTEPFGAPVQLTTGIDVKDPAVAADELELYSADLGQLYVRSRVTAASTWGPPVAVTLPASNDPYAEQSPSFTADGLTLYFSSMQTGNAIVMRTRRASRTAPWQEEEDAGPRGGVGVRRDDLEIFSQDFLSPIRHMVRSSTAEPFANGADLVGPVNDGSMNDTPALSGDGLELYFTTNRTGTKVLHVARRTSLTAPFDSVVSLGISGEMPEISVDGRHLYFIVDTGINYDLWLASRCD